MWAEAGQRSTKPARRTLAGAIVVAFAACRAPAGAEAGRPPDLGPPLDTAAQPTEPGSPGPTQRPPPGNLLIVLLDDVGVDNLAAYGLAPDAPPTPTLDALADDGVLFRWAYASPICSPTRANLMTGRHARRTGVGALVEPTTGFELDRDEVGLAELLAHSPWAWDSSATGKWHLSAAKGQDPASHPAAMGFSWFSGSLDNVMVSHDDTLEDKDYWYWEKVDNGAYSVSTTYVTTDTTDDAIARVTAMTEPWLMYVAWHSPHMPWHEPPAELHTQVLGTEPTDDRLYDAMLESVDTELGRLLDAMDPDLRERTTIVVMGDNGSPDQVITPPFDPAREKGTLYEGGVRVPLIVSGALVAEPGRDSDALVHAVDVFATVADFAEVPLTGPEAPPFSGPIDGISFLPQLLDPYAPHERERAFVERFEPLGTDPTIATQMLHDREWKVITFTGADLPPDMLFRLEPGGLDEGPDLLAAGEEALAPEAAEAYARLSAELDAYTASLTP